MSTPTLSQIGAWPATISLAQAAGALGVSESHLRNLVKAGKEPCRVLKLGHRHRVVTASLIACLTNDNPTGDDHA